MQYRNISLDANQNNTCYIAVFVDQKVICSTTLLKNDMKMWEIKNYISQIVMLNFV